MTLYGLYQEHQDGTKELHEVSSRREELEEDARALNASGDRFWVEEVER